MTRLGVGAISTAAVVGIVATVLGVAAL